jgi:hypothetical protein
VTGAPHPEIVSTRQQRIAPLAKPAPQRGFTSLNPPIDRHWLHEAYLRTRRDGAPGVDGQTAADDTAHLPGTLQSLLDRAKSGRYRAPPVRRVHIPKGGQGRDTPDRHPNLRGQGAAACGRHGVGADLRAGLSGLFVGLPTRTVGASGLGSVVAADQAQGWRRDLGRGHPDVVRHSGSSRAAGVVSPAGA